ncbi:MAG: MFS transporter [Actinobacteria bacterium]|nr:MFS transporter [Actinomycetota bacterium]
MSARLRTFGAALVINAAAALPALLVGALALQLRRDLGFGDTALGAALGLYFAVAAVCGPFGGRLAEQFGWRRSLDVAAGISASVLLGIATLAHSFASLVPFLILGGVSISLAIPTSNLVLSREMPAGRQGLLFGVKQASIPFAGLLAGLSLPVVALTIGWRWAFVAGLVVPLAAALAVPRRALGGPEPKRQRADTASMSSIATPSLVTLAVGGGLAMAGVGALNAFVVVATVDAGLEEATAGLLVALASVVGLSVRIIAGWWADRRSSGGFLPVAGLLAAGAGG